MTLLLYAGRFRGPGQAMHYMLTSGPTATEGVLSMIDRVAARPAGEGTELAVVPR
jgi:hypothetical protein